MQDETFDGLLDIARLNDWIAGQDLPGDGPVTSVVKLQGGSQNNIFRLRRGDAEMVLRRPPRHLRDNSNDTMLREARVLGALSGTPVPHPELYGHCADLDVIGCCFYLMAPIDGFTPTGELPSDTQSAPSGGQRFPSRWSGPLQRSRASTTWRSA